ncbi:MAG: cytochrome C [Burkholderiales bacterium]|nr:cytochrome C [Burkholderiales bacterium]
MFGVPAQAVPSFAAQTGQSCVACHAGGQFPELTPYGRMFKLTGYTMGQRANPLSAMVVASNTTTKESTGSVRDGQTILDSASVFLAGKVTDNIGGFGQFTHSFPAAAAGMDNMDLRYADREVNANTDLVWGVSLHNNPTVQDVWNSAPAWSSPYMKTTQGAYGDLPRVTVIENGLSQQVAGIGGYAYLNKSFYAELASYQAPRGALSFMAYPANVGDTTNPFNNYLDGSNLYWRLAYTREWDAHNVMVGAFGFDAKVVGLDGNAVPDATVSYTRYRDVGFDAQYQYLLSPHTFTAQLRAVRETIDDTLRTTYFDGPATLNTLSAKASYVYREQYGGSLTYKKVNGSADSNAYGAPSLVPDSELWIPELFWIPRQNVRIGVQFNSFTKYLGASSNYDGLGRNASDNNSTYVYLWAAF